MSELKEEGLAGLRAGREEGRGAAARSSSPTHRLIHRRPPAARDHGAERSSPADGVGEDWGGREAAAAAAGGEGRRETRGQWRGEQGVEGRRERGGGGRPTGNDKWVLLGLVGMKYCEI